MTIKFLGHSCFEIETEKGKILIDPFLVASPDYDPNGVTDIFVTHGHGDHLGSAIEISKKTGAKITAIFELANYCSKKGANANGVGLGSWMQYPWGRVIAVPAYHSSSTPDGNYAGCPCGFVFAIRGKSIYHAGDTCLNQEMKTIRELYSPEIAILPVGGYYTMDIEQAVNAAEWIGASYVIPMHYNTFDAISVDITNFERQIRNNGKVPVIMEVGRKID
ncbi:MAG: metal-dependent hydrolase [bacterium]|nr:metal-dependent hydrolase [bacterium]